jgi:hypothetical protein
MFNVEAFNAAVRDLCRPSYRQFPKDAKTVYARAAVIAEEKRQREGRGTEGFKLNRDGFLAGPTHELWTDLKKYTPRGDQWQRNKPTVLDFLKKESNVQ